MTTDSASSTDSDSEQTVLQGHVFAPVSAGTISLSVHTNYFLSLLQCPHSHACPLVAAATDEGATKATRGGPCRFGQRVALDLSNVL